MQQKVYTKDEIIRLLEVNPKAVDRAMLALYERQTADERVAGITRHSNGIGVNAAHARPLSYYVGWLRNGRRLTGRHFETARKIAKHYAGQLAEVANQNQHRRQSVGYSKGEW